MGYINKNEALAKIKWSLYKGAPHRTSLPDGKWGINADGDYYLGNFDEYESYYYFNADYSWYFRNNNPESQTTATYMSPRGEKFLKPSESSPLNPTYFIGVDSVTKRDQVFFQDESGRIVRAFRKFVGNTESLRRFNIRTSRGASGEEVFTFDVGGAGESRFMGAREVVRALESWREDSVVRRLEFKTEPLPESDVREYVEEDDEVVFVKSERVGSPFIDLYD